MNQQRFTGAYVFTVNNAPMTWCTNKQRCVT
jgi:hypothetical protein